MENLALSAVVVFIVGAVGVVGYLIYDDFTSEKFSLRKDEWSCTRSHNETRLMPSGKIIVPTVHTVCDQWSRA